MCVEKNTKNSIHNYKKEEKNNKIFNIKKEETKRYI